MSISNSRTSLLLIAATLVGCGPSSPNVGPPPPHAGTLIPLPDKQGYAEIVKKAVEGQAEQIQLLVYFLDLDLKPLASPPSAATFKPTDRAVKELDLKASGDPDQSIASPPFSDPGELEGRLSTTINGKPITLSIRVR